MKTNRITENGLSSRFRTFIMTVNSMQTYHSEIGIGD